MLSAKSGKISRQLKRISVLTNSVIRNPATPASQSGFCRPRPDRKQYARAAPAGAQARRWCVLDMAPTRANDRAYFRAIAAELNDGGMAALMHYLMTFDLASVDVHTTPKTNALLEQKEESLPPHAQWWLETLKRGSFRYQPSDPSFLDPNKFERNSETDGWPVSMQKDHLWDAYRLWMREHNVRSRVITSMWQQLRLRSVTALLPKTDNRPVGDRKRRSEYQAWPQSFPTMSFPSYGHGRTRTARARYRILGFSFGSELP